MQQIPRTEKMAERYKNKIDLVKAQHEKLKTELEIVKEKGKALETIKALGITDLKTMQALLNLGGEQSKGDNKKGKTVEAIDSVRMFVDLCLRPSIPPNAENSRWEMEGDSLYVFYKAFLKEFHFATSISRNTFVSHLKTILPSHYVPRRKMRSSETIIRPIPHISSYWAKIAIVEAAFTVDPERTSARCNSTDCKKGGLACFAALHSSSGWS